MYSFEYGGNILEYFARYRRKLESREDIRHVSALSSDDERRLLSMYIKPRTNSVADPPGVEGSQRQHAGNP
jgi:hypothetical protein